MRVNKKKKIVTFSPSDKNNWQVRLVNKKGELINIKITFTSKGFGIQAFRELETGVEKKDLSLFSGDEYIDDTEYVGVWKM